MLVERGELNREASGTNAGSFHFQIALHQLTAWETDNVRDRLQTEVRLHVEAAEIWKALETELDGPLDIHTTGGLMVAETADELQLLRDKHVIEEEAGLETHVLTGARSATSPRTSPTTWPVPRTVPRKATPTRSLRRRSLPSGLPGQARSSARTPR